MNTPIKKSQHPYYVYYARMKGSVLRSKHAEYEHVGARGIKIDPELLDFWNFVALVDAHISPGQPGDLLARIDRTKDFTISNLGWQKPHSCRKAIVPERQIPRFHGIVWDKKGHSKPWKAQISVNGRAVHIGYYANQEDAAKAYDKEAKKVGKILNFPS